jgi:hypothetical protein
MHANTAALCRLGPRPFVGNELPIDVTKGFDGMRA